jgi:DNA-binding MarR family transcriptional regulator
VASQDEVASILKVDKGTAARAIAKLETEGYVERKVFTTDKRIEKLYLTDKAHTFEKNLLKY